MYAWIVQHKYSNFIMLNFISKWFPGRSTKHPSSFAHLNTEGRTILNRLRTVLLNETVLRNEMGVTQLFDYRKPNIGEQILEHFGEAVIHSCVSGQLPLSVRRSELNEFSTHMAAAAIFDDPVGVAMSCFTQQTNAFALFLPVPARYMSPESKTILIALTENRTPHDTSRSGTEYLSEHYDDLFKN